MEHQAPIDKPKGCWFPFKQAYQRRRIKPEYEDPPNVYYLKSGQNQDGRPMEVALYEYDETSSQQAGATELVLEGHPNPLEMMSTMNPQVEDNSVISEEDQLLFQMPMAQLANINPNCMTKEFWVDEIVEGGSLACVEEMLPSARRTRSNSLDTKSVGLTSETASPEEGSLYRESSTPKARIEIEYDFSQHHPDETGTLSTAQRSSLAASACGTAPMFSKRNQVESLEEHTRGDVSSVLSNDMSTLASEHDSADPTQSSLTKSARVIMVDPPAAEPTSRRVLCGVVKRNRRKRDPPANKAKQSPMDDPGRGKLDGKSSPTSVIPANEAEPVPTDSSAWLHKSVPFAAKNCVVPNKCQLQYIARDPPQDPLEPHFYVEVEATPRQLGEVKDIETFNPDIELEAQLAKEVEIARTASLVDEDSAFMENQCMKEAMRRLSPKRLGGNTKQNIPAAKPVVERVPSIPMAPSRTMGSRHSRQSVSSVKSARSTESVGQNTSRSVNPESVANRSSQSKISRDTRRTAEEKERELDRSVEEQFLRASSTPSMRRSSGSKHSNGRVRSALHENPQELGLSGDSAIGADMRIGQEPEVHDTEEWRVRDRSRQRSFSRTGVSELTTETRDSVAAKRRTENLGRSTISELTTEVGQPYEENDSVSAALSTGQSHDWFDGHAPMTSQARLSSNSGLRGFQDDHGLHDEPLGHFSHDSDKPNLFPVAEDFEAGNWDASDVHRAPSLDESFTKAVPFGPDRSGLEKGINESHDLNMSLGIANGRSGLSSQHLIHPPHHMKSREVDQPSSAWFDDDSALNTEAFKKLAAGDDDDSIFQGLAERSTKGEDMPVEEDSPSVQDFEKVAQMEETSRVSRDSDNSRDQSRYTSYSRDNRSKYSRVSRGDYSRSSRQSRQSKLSKYSRGTIYTESRSMVDEPFACMDKWLD